jgi:hypothetical protein
LKRFCVTVHNKNVCAHNDLMSKAKSLACFLDTTTTNELAVGVKYNHQEWAGERHAFLLLHDYLKLVEGAHVDEIAKLTKAQSKVL